MSLSLNKIDQITAYVKAGKLSNVKIAKEVGCSESAVRTTIKKFNIKKNEINDLAKIEVQNIIIQNEIKTRKNEFTSKERDQYDSSLIEEFDKAKAFDLFNNATIQNQKATNTAADELDKIIQNNPIAAIEHLPNLLAISRATEQNRKQIFGITQPREEVKSNDKIIFNMDFGSGED